MNISASIQLPFLITILDSAHGNGIHISLLSIQLSFLILLMEMVFIYEYISASKLI